MCPYAEYTQVRGGDSPMATHAVTPTRWTDRHESLMWVLSLAAAHWRTLTTAGVFIYLLLVP